MKSVIVKDRKGAYEILKDYIGHTLKDVRYSDGTHVEQLDGEILLEFDEPAQEQCDLLNIAEQKEVLRCFRVRSEHGNSLAYDNLHTKLCERYLPDVDGDE